MFVLNAVNYLLAKKVVKFSKFIPRPDQELAIEEAEINFIVEDQPRGQLIVPCAVGKTFIGLWIAESLFDLEDAKNVLIIAPNLNLVKQNLEAWTRHARVPYSYQALCSDDSVGKGMEEISETGLINVSTNIEQLSLFLLNNNDEPKALFSTYQSIPTLAALCQKVNFKFDFAIFDEARPG